MNFNPFFAQTLRERDLQLSEIDIRFCEDNVTTVYTVTLADGRVGTFEVENAALENAVLTNTVNDLLYPHIVKMEFHNDDKPVPEVPAEPTAETTDPADDGESPSPAEPEDTSSSEPDPGDGDTPAAGDAGKKPKSRRRTK